MNFDGSDHQFIVALNKENGQTVWEKQRSIDYKDLGPDGKPQTDGDLRKAFSTPHVTMLDGKAVRLSSGAKAHYAYDPLTGEEFWRVEERSCHSASGRAVVGQGLVFVTAGFSRGTLLAVSPGKIAGPGPRVIDASDEPTSMLGQSASLSEVNSWRPFTIEFTTSANTRAVEVLLSRQACANNPCAAFGTLWLDSFSLETAANSPQK